MGKSIKLNNCEEWGWKWLVGQCHGDVKLDTIPNFVSYYEDQKDSVDMEQVVTNDIHNKTNSELEIIDGSDDEDGRQSSGESLKGGDISCSSSWSEPEDGNETVTDCDDEGSTGTNEWCWMEYLYLWGGYLKWMCCLIWWSLLEGTE